VPPINKLLPPKDGTNRLRITSVIREGDPAPTIYFAGTISPDVVTVMARDRGRNGPRDQRLMQISAYLMQQLDGFCTTALGPPGGS
jgi:hypothetical protein